MSTPDTTYDLMKDQEFKNLMRQANDCLECGKCSGGCPMMDLFPEYFNPHHVLEKLTLQPAEVLSAPDIWFCASCYRCNKQCPQGIELPEMFVKLRRMVMVENGLDPLTRAMEVIRERIPFYASFFRVCYHPERIPLDEKIVKKLISTKGIPIDRKPLLDTGKHIAIVGSGPAGLYAAYLLRMKGVMVTIFESKDKAGGMLRRCIPEFRLPSSDMDEDIKRMKEMGIEIKTRTSIGKRTNIRNLKIKFDAVFLATGAHHILRLKVPGEDLPGVYGSLDFLEQLKKGKVCQGCIERAVVIGGGNTAMDVASTIKQMGAEHVMLLYRRTMREMPADINEIAEAEKEGVEIHELVAPVAFVGNDFLESIECQKMELGPADFSGRRRPLPVKDSNFTIETDLVVNAIGEKPTVDYLPDLIEINRDGSIATNPITMETSMEGVFAGGDVVMGSSTVSEAITSAIRAVNGIEKYLQK